MVQVTRFQSVFARVGRVQVFVVFFPLMAARTKAQHCPGLLHTHTEQIHILSRLFSGFLAILWFVLAKDMLRTKLSE